MPGRPWTLLPTPGAEHDTKGMVRPFASVRLPTTGRVQTLFSYVFKKEEKNMKVCPKCGSQMNDTDLFCQTCGMSFGGGAPHENPPSAFPERARRHERHEDLPSVGGEAVFFKGMSCLNHCK